VLRYAGSPYLQWAACCGQTIEAFWSSISHAKPRWYPVCLTTVQVAWVLAYTTAANEAYLNRLVTLGIVKPLVDRLAAAVDQVRLLKSP
jgi:hypothetical protein